MSGEQDRGQCLNREDAKSAKTSSESLHSRLGLRLFLALFVVSRFRRGAVFPNCSVQMAFWS